MAKQSIVLTKTEIWATQDGFNFSKKGNLPALSPSMTKDQMKVAILNGKIYLIAPDVSGQRKLWKSEDGGSSWVVVLDSVASVFNYTNTTTSLIAFNNALYVVGSTDNSANDTLRSNDEGATWQVVPPVGALGTRQTASYALLNGQAFLYAYSNYNHYTSDFVNFTGFTNRTTIDVTNVCSTGTKLFAMIWDGNGLQIHSSTNGILFTKLTSFVYGDEEYGITENLPPNTAFMTNGTSYVFEFNNRVYFINSANKGVMSAPSSNPTNLQSEANSTIPSSVLVWTTGDISTASLPISASADFTGTSSFSGAAVLDGVATSLSASATFTGVSLFAADGTLISTTITPLETSSNFSANASFSSVAEIFEILYRGGTVKLNGQPMQLAKVYAVRVSDDVLFVLTTDSNGKYLIPDGAGECHVFCVYKDGQNNTYSALVQPFVRTVN